MSDSLTDRIFYERHHDDDYFDEVRITTVPRYKTSGLSGNEWRISARIELLRKGHVVASNGYRNVETAAMALPWFITTAREDPEFQPLARELDESLCFQPGCGRQATTEYEIKKQFCVRCGQGKAPTFKHMRIKFCARHARRGDCGLHDADDNYIVVNGHGPNAPALNDVKPAVFGGVVNVATVDELPDAIKSTIDELRKLQAK